MNVSDICKFAQAQFEKVNKLPVVGIVGICKAEEGWQLSLEVVERRAIPDTMDVLGLYELALDEGGNLLNFRRKTLRKRGETKEDHN